LKRSSDLVFKEHMVPRLQADTSFHDVLNTGSLFEESVNNRSSCRNKGCFEQIAEDGEDRVETTRLWF
jgi:hypothetical protein